MNYCYKCGSELINDKVVFCHNCGQDLNKPVSFTPSNKMLQLAKQLTELGYSEQESNEIIMLSEYYKDYWDREQKRIINTLEKYRYDAFLISLALAFGEKNNLDWNEVSKILLNAYSQEDIDRQREELLNELHKTNSNLEKTNNLVQGISTNLKNANDTLDSINFNSKLIYRTVFADFFIKNMLNYKR